MAGPLYKTVQTSTVVACSTTAAVAVATPAAERGCLRILNMAATNLYVKFIDYEDAAVSAPTFTTMVTNGYSSTIVLPGATHYEECGPSVAAYLVLASGTGNVCAEELA